MKQKLKSKRAVDTLIPSLIFRAKNDEKMSAGEIFVSANRQKSDLILKRKLKSKRVADTLIPSLIFRAKNDEKNVSRSNF